MNVVQISKGKAARKAPTDSDAIDWLSERFDEGMARWREKYVSYHHFQEAIFDVTTEVLEKMGIDFDHATEEQIGASAAIDLSDHFDEMMDQLLWTLLETIKVRPLGSKRRNSVAVFAYLTEKAKRTQECN